MAEDDAEKAFFQAQAMSADSVSFDGPVEGHGADHSDSEDYDPSKALQDQLSASVPESKQSDSQDPSTVNVPSASHPTKDSSLPPDMDQIHQNTDTYPSQTPSRTDSRASASIPSSAVHVQPKTKTLGGFVVEDDEEEEDDKDEAEYEPPAVLGGVEDVGPVSASMSERPISENANETVSTSGVSVQPPAPDMASSKDVSNNSSSSLPTSVTPQNGGSFASGQNMYNVQAGDITDSHASTPTPAVASASRGRLPHDRVGILEDRIKEDPRGDMDAWLELINEHRSRNRIDSARDVYERFFKVFPSAVSFTIIFFLNPLQCMELTLRTG